MCLHDVCGATGSRGQLTPYSRLLDGRAVCSSECPRYHCLLLVSTVPLSIASQGPGGLEGGWPSYFGYCTDIIAFTGPLPVPVQPSLVQPGTAAPERGWAQQPRIGKQASAPLSRCLTLALPHYSTPRAASLFREHACIWEHNRNSTTPLRATPSHLLACNPFHRKKTLCQPWPTRTAHRVGSPLVRSQWGAPDPRPHQGDLGPHPTP